MQLADSSPARKTSASNGARATRVAVESEIIEHFVDITRVLGVPRSLAEIYGLLFISPQPLAMDHLIERLQISKGSASQGLKFLRELGAVETVELEDDRRTHYVAVAELRKLAARFLRDQLAPQVAGNEERLEKLSDVLDTLPEDDRSHVEQRIKVLRNWNKNTRRVLPIVVKVLGE